MTTVTRVKDKLTPEQREAVEFVRHKSKDYWQLKLLEALDAVAPRCVFPAVFPQVTPPGVSKPVQTENLDGSRRVEFQDSLASQWPKEPA